MLRSITALDFDGLSRAMPSSQVANARRQYLNEASQLLMVSSPAVSAYLQHVSAALQRENDKAPAPTTHIRSCNACGSLMVPGWNCVSFMEKKQNSRDQRGKLRNNEPHDKTMRLTCSRCGASTTIHSHQSRKSAKVPLGTLKNPTQPRPAQSEAQPQVPRPDTKPTSSATSRKARAKKASLQSLVTDSKRFAPVQKHEAGPDLMDFMKT